MAGDRVSEADVIDGKAFAAGLRARIADAVPAFKAATGRVPGLAVVLVGDDPASAVYVGSKGKATLAAGMESFEHRLPATATQDEVEALLAALNTDEAVDGILLQLPLPGRLPGKGLVEHQEQGGKEDPYGRQGAESPHHDKSLSFHRASFPG